MNRLTTSKVKIGEDSILTTFNNELLAVPYQVKVTTTKWKNHTFGNYLDYSVVVSR
ncbi:hypothetical protein RGU12_11760 [Fredinandcohnia sp. QZ13]|uniref:hypothetical protein n=1 Tax=Fredinandcohnia sp. QZ13 TaxID=3073144 RepID=UPI0028532F75|nr:hypothetical protein [Fredinandcohnia sp. QZ13]MDR4888227.1 hypothetical protein [Fredinandcohnia sp. QZ13]